MNTRDYEACILDAAVGCESALQRERQALNRGDLYSAVAWADTAEACSSLAFQYARYL